MTLLVMTVQCSLRKTLKGLGWKSWVDEHMEIGESGVSCEGMEAPHPFPMLCASLHPVGLSPLSSPFCNWEMPVFL